MELSNQSVANLAVGVLAGERPGPSELSEGEGVALKVLVDIAGRPMLARVLDAAAGAFPDAVHLVGGPDAARIDAAPWLRRRLDDTGLAWVAPADSPSRSTRAMVEAGLARGADAVAITTGDHPLLTSSTFESFVADALRTDADAVVGLADFAAVRAAFPASRRTALRFADGPRCGCNLFLFRGAGAVRVLDFWQRVERDRKRPDRILRVLGASFAMRYMAGRLPLGDALARLEEITGARIAVVRVADPDAAVDVDNLEDLATVRARWELREGHAVVDENS